VSAEDALAIIDIRIELEGLAARLAVQNFTAADTRRLREISAFDATGCGG